MMELRITFVLLCLSSLSIGGGELSGSLSQDTPANIFADGVVNTSIIWWRPYKVVFDPNKVADLQEEIKPVSEAQASTIDLSFNRDERSAFLFPVLACNNKKGAILLGRYLDEYEDKKKLDDQWLLIIASLGRSPTEEAQIALESELEELFEKYDPMTRRKIDGKNIKVLRRKDARVPVVDALLCNLSQQKKLTAERIRELEEKFEDGFIKNLCWDGGLEWARRFMGEEETCKIIVDGLSMCEDEQLDNAVSLRGSSDRVRAIISFLSGPSDVWPLTKNILMKQHNKMREPVLKFIMVHYARLLTYEAEAKEGNYNFDEDAIDLYYKYPLSDCESFKFVCEVLRRCKPSREDGKWQGYLEECSDAFVSEYKVSALSQVKRIYGESEIPRSNHERLDPNEIYGRFKEPGIYMVGFTGGIR